MERCQSAEFIIRLAQFGLLLVGQFRHGFQHRKPFEQLRDVGVFIAPLLGLRLQKVAFQAAVEVVEIVAVVFRAVLADDLADVVGQIVGKSRESGQHDRYDIFVFPDRISQFAPHPVLRRYGCGIGAAVERTLAQDEDEIAALVDAAQQLRVEIAVAKRVDVEADAVTVLRQKIVKVLRRFETAATPVTDENIVCHTPRLRPITRSPSRSRPCGP